MTARVYTPDAVGLCTVCSRPEDEHSRSGGWEGDEARCMPVVEYPGVELAVVALAQRTAAAFRTDITAESAEVTSETDVNADTVTNEKIDDYVRNNRRDPWIDGGPGKGTVADAATVLRAATTPSDDKVRIRGEFARLINASAKGGR